jgi:hypothetical protein
MQRSQKSTNNFEFFKYQMFVNEALFKFLIFLIWRHFLSQFEARSSWSCCDLSINNIYLYYIIIIGKSTNASAELRKAIFDKNINYCIVDGTINIRVTWISRFTWKFRCPRSEGEDWYFLNTFPKYQVKFFSSPAFIFIQKPGLNTKFQNLI